jgi:hypothetical protein
LPPQQEKEIGRPCRLRGNRAAVGEGAVQPDFTLHGVGVGVGVGTGTVDSGLSDIGGGGSEFVPVPGWMISGSPTVDSG